LPENGESGKGLYPAQVWGGRNGGNWGNTSKRGKIYPALILIDRTGKFLQEIPVSRANRELPMTPAQESKILHGEPTDEIPILLPAALPD